MRRMLQGSVQWLGMVMAEGVTSLIREKDKAGARVWNKILGLVSICREIKIQRLGFFFFTPDSYGDACRRMIVDMSEGEM